MYILKTTGIQALRYGVRSFNGLTCKMCSAGPGILMESLTDQTGMKRQGNETTGDEMARGRNDKLPFAIITQINLTNEYMQ